MWFYCLGIDEFLYLLAHFHFSFIVFTNLKEIDNVARDLNVKNFHWVFGPNLYFLLLLVCECVTFSRRRFEREKSDTGTNNFTLDKQFYSPNNGGRLRHQRALKIHSCKHIRKSCKMLALDDAIYKFIIASLLIASGFIYWVLYLTLIALTSK